MDAGTSGISREDQPSTSNGNHDHLNHEGDDHFAHVKRLGSGSSTSSGSSFDAFQLDINDVARIRAAVNPDDEKILDSDECLTPLSSMDVPERPSDLSSEDDLISVHFKDHPLTESPGVQVMERTSDASSGDGDATRYRIPSAVFARAKSTAPGEWSVTSNESLFSIHMGNMSFNTDLYWMAKSGELGKNGEPIMYPMDYSSNHPPPPVDHPSTPSPPLPDYSPPAPVNKSPETSKRNTNLDEGLCATPEAVETMKSVLRENADRGKGSVSIAEGIYCPSSSHHSTASGGSTTSFAFPILTGDGDKNTSSRMGKGTAGSSKKNPQPPPVQLQSQPQPQPEKPESPKPAPTGGPSKWFSCFSCCSFCS